MIRIAIGLAAAALLASGVFLWMRSTPATAPTLAAAAAVAAEPPPARGEGPMPEPPAADTRTREAQRFARYDKDRDGAVRSAEYLDGRRRAFAKLDGDGDGRLSFEEYAAKAIARYGAADKDRSGALDAAEFATTRPVRKSRPLRCPPREPAEEG
ncbi:histidine kinase [Sphingomonas morindae]|uniref:Histidine kinase n=1 Tax=Sphingomonas morindae TaxID=1541170 RepID=A0ABY4X8N7_9SPHN|nr:histidine kinase [Sphingomonas morindae]USI73025.1 histidine kinase [Sphingomonas morindae]